jgi:hypothetical protein
MLANIDALAADAPQIQRLEQQAQRAPSQVTRETAAAAGDESPLTPFLEQQMRPQLAEAAARPTPSQLARQAPSAPTEFDLQPWLSDARRVPNRVAGAKPTPAQLAQQPAESAMRPAAGFGEQATASIGADRQARAMEEIERLRSNPRMRAADAKRFIQATDRVERGKGFAPGTYIPEAARAARSARRAVNRNLKELSPEYASIMREVSADTGAATRASDLIGKKSEGAGADYLRGLLFKDTRRKHDIARLRAVDKRLGTAGQSTVETAMDQAALDMFGNANTQGSRRVLAGGAIGNEFGPAGRIAGVVTGLTGDIYGARLARGTIRGGVKLSDKAERILSFVPAMQAQSPRAARMIQQAMRDRDNPERAVVVADFVLRQQDPEYRAMRSRMDQDERESAEVTP